MKIKRSLHKCIFAIAPIAIIAVAFFAMANHSIDSHATDPRNAERTTFEKAFQEVAYAYYMRGTNLQYNNAKTIFASPEETTTQDRNYMVCGAFEANVYKELLGITLSLSGMGDYNYAKTYIGERPEVIGYGELQDSGDLYWYDGSKNGSGELNVIQNPTQSYLISQLKIGDILHYKGHVMLVYDYVYDSNGNVDDVYLIHSYVADTYYTRTKSDMSSSSWYYYDKNGNKTFLPKTYALWSKLFYINHAPTSGLDITIPVEGTVQIDKLKNGASSITKHFLFDKTNPNNIYNEQYVILRFVTTDENGDSILNFDGSFDFYTGTKIDNQKIEYSDSVKSRLDYSSLYIEKTVDKRDGNTVQENDELTYEITIKNNSTSAYTKDLIVTENLSKHVNYLSATVSKNGINIEKNGNILTWNLGKLGAKETITIKYTVKVKENTSGNTIVSTGKVANIPSGTVENEIGSNLTNAQANSIEQKYNELKNTYTGAKLVNEIYKQALDTDLGLEDFKMRASSEDDASGLIYYNNLWGKWHSMQHDVYMATNKTNDFSDMVLNGYFNSMYDRKTTYTTIDDLTVHLRSLPGWGTERNNPDDRAKTIYPEDFQTGDILIYTNTDDSSYYHKTSNDHLAKWKISDEDGEYYYIYIEGEGFVGMNTGKNASLAKDDRDGFNTSYFDNVSQRVYVKSGNPQAEMTDELLEWLHYQSLFGKDNYVILRPALVLNKNPNAVISDDDDEPGTDDNGNEIPSDESGDTHEDTYDEGDPLDDENTTPDGEPEPTDNAGDDESKDEDENEDETEDENEDDNKNKDEEPKEEDKKAEDKETSDGEDEDDKNKTEDKTANEETKPSDSNVVEKNDDIEIPNTSADVEENPQTVDNVWLYIVLLACASAALAYRHRRINIG